MEITVERAKRHRRTHTAEFKARVIEASRQPGVSLAAAAMANGINANLLRRWVAAQEPCQIRSPTSQRSVLATAEFVPLQMPTAPRVEGNICVEVRRGATAVTVSWPVHDSSVCVAWLRDWLK